MHAARDGTACSKLSIIKYFSSFFGAETSQTFFHASLGKLRIGEGDLLPDNSLLSLIIAQIGVGGLGGFALGVVLRRITSMMVGAISFLFAMILLLLGGLTKLGVRIVNPESTEKLVVGVVNAGIHGLLSTSATALPFGSGFSFGLCVGLLMGKPQTWI